MKILVVDDEKSKRVSLLEDLAGEGHEVTVAETGEEALECLADASFDVVLTDLRMPGIDGLELLGRAKRSGGAVPPEVILMTAYGSIPLAVDAMRMGAFDFIPKPFSNEAIFPLLARIEEERATVSFGPDEARPIPSRSHGVRVVGDSPAMRRVKKLIEVCAQSTATVLLTGETGAGKDLVAAAIHTLSPRRSGPFVKVCCAVLPAPLVGSELYGHQKGSFTGAHHGTKGRVALAEGGTLYLDDVDDIPLEQQIKLLRVIEEKVYEPVGGRLAKADVRIIASTKQGLLLRTQDDTFRSDLYYRLNVLRLDVPPLRERLEDVPLLARHFLRQLSGKPDEELDPDALAVLRAHTWPGNVRELAHVLERAFLIGEGRITTELLDIETGAAQVVPAPTSGEFGARVQATERQLLEEALVKNRGNQSAAARSLGMRRSTFRDKCTKYGLE